MKMDFNSLWPIDWPNAGLLSTGSLGINQISVNQKTTIFIWENQIKNVVCKMMTTLFPPECVNIGHGDNPKRGWIGLYQLTPSWSTCISNTGSQVLTHCGRVTHICISKPTIIGSDNGLSPGRRQAVIWTDDGILLMWTLGTNFGEIRIKIKKISFTKKASENIICETAAILSRGKCVNRMRPCVYGITELGYH